MKPTLDELKATLFDTNDGGIACDAINALTKRAKKGNHEAKSILAEYVGTGRVPWMRTHACSCLATTIAPTDMDFAEVFERRPVRPAHTLLEHSRLHHDPGSWRLSGPDENRRGRDRSHRGPSARHRRLASFSKRRFDRQLPPDPGKWEASDLRLGELATWAQAGYPDGEGKPTPRRHPALDQPTSDFEMIVSRLDKKLARIRRRAPGCDGAGRLACHRRSKGH